MLKYLLFLAVFKVLGRLPITVLYRIAAAVAAVAYIASPRARANVWDNLRHAMPRGTSKREIRRAARQVFRNVVLYYADLAHMPHMEVDDFFERRLITHGLYENLIPAVESEKGVIMLGAHFGNPELAAQGLIPVGVRVFALTEPLQPRRLSRMIDGIRSCKGHTFAPVSVGSVKKVIKTLKSGGVVALVGDRDIEGPRQSLPFLGVETLMPTGPIEVALRTGATVIPSFATRNGYLIDAYMEEPLELEVTGDFPQDVRTGTLRFLERFERRLRADPGQWAVLESIWEKPAAAVKARASVAGKS